MGGGVRVDGRETSCERDFLTSLSHGEGEASPKSCSSGTSHSDTQSGRTGSRTQDMAKLIKGGGGGGGGGTTRDAQGKIAKGGANLQILGAAIGGNLTRVSNVARLRGLRGPFPWGPADGD